ncbi:hypothetical protein [Inquilinus sp. OTU3971]|uniref:hypothetical protein n=1 Tax=Inquilinus sp. OTU3971 TaxID=3043855 RepID=UPI00313EA36A
MAPTAGRILRPLLPGLAAVLLAVGGAAAQEFATKDAPFDSVARAALKERGAPDGLTLWAIDELQGNHTSSVRPPAQRNWYKDAAGKNWAVQLTAQGRVIVVYAP